MKATRHMLAPQPPTPAQLVAGVLGGLLVVVGLIGLAVNSSFDTGSALTSDDLLGFAVNGWENVIPGVAFGLILLAGAPRPAAARMACRLIGIVFLVLFFAGLGGEDAFAWVPANTPDDVLRAVLALVLLGAAAASKDRRDVLLRDRVRVAEPEDPTHVVGPGSGHVGGPRAIGPRIDRRLPSKQHP
jgi:hypothetical protein